MNPILILIFGIFLLVIAGRFFLERAVQKLDQDKKAALTTISTRRNIISYLISFILLVAILFDIFYDWLTPVQNLYLIAGLGIAGVSIDKFLRFQQLKKHDFPSSYIRVFLLTTLVQVAILALVVAWMFIYMI